MKLESDNKILQDLFAWAVNKTKCFVVTGVKSGAVNKGDGGKWYGPNGEIAISPSKNWAQPKNYMPSYWAGYFDRTAFYIRDFVHQAVGAHLVGLDEENYNMFYTFASNASKKTGWFAPWSFNFDGSIYYMDTPSFRHFVREITAQFELVETAYKLYLWTNDSRYIFDDVIFNFITHIMNDFITELDGIVLGERNGIPEGLGDIFKISSTYNERGFHAAEAGDSIGAMYQAILSYAEILKLRGNIEQCNDQLKRAGKLRKYFNDDWSIVKNKPDVVAYAIDNKGKKHHKWKKRGKTIHGGASLFFIPLKKLLYEGQRNDKLLGYIQLKESKKRTREDNIESLTYLADMFFSNNQADRAWFWMKHIYSLKDAPHERPSQGLNGDYPEISFTFISQVVEGMMGVKINAENGNISLCPNLPSEIKYIKLVDLAVGKKLYDISINDDVVKIVEKQ